MFRKQAEREKEKPLEWNHSAKINVFYKKEEERFLTPHAHYTVFCAGKSCISDKTRK